MFLPQSTFSLATMTVSWRGSARGWPPPTAPQTSTRLSGNELAAGCSYPICVQLHIYSGFLHEQLFETLYLNSTKYSLNSQTTMASHLEQVQHFAAVIGTPQVTSKSVNIADCHSIRIILLNERQIGECFNCHCKRLSL